MFGRMNALSLAMGLYGGARPQRIIPFNSSVGYIGDSIIAHGYLAATANRLFFNDNGFTTWLSVFAGGGLTMPPGASQGVSGETMAQIAARISSMTGLAGGCPVVVVLEGGINDIFAGTAAATIINGASNSRATAIAALRTAGAIVINCTIVKTFGAGALTGAQETQRQAANQLIRAQAVRNQVITLDIDAPITSSGQMDSDGIHPNVSGSYAIGRPNGLNPLGLYMQQGDPISLLQGGTVFVNNLPLSGTGGTLLNTCTGVVADGHRLDNTNAQGPIAAGSKSADGKQVVTLSGTCTSISGDGPFVEFLNTNTTGFPSVGDVLEGICALEILTPLVNVSSLSLDCRVLNAAFGILGEGGGANPVELEMFPMLVGDGKLVFRTPRFTVAAGTPARFNISIFCKFPVGSAIPVSGAFKVDYMGMRKTN